MIRAVLSKVNFALGGNPKVRKRGDWRNYIPNPYKAVLLISTDFEMAWAWQFSKNSPNPLKEAKKLALIERENVPLILQICDEYNIPLTWATVGHLFLNSCNSISGCVHPDILRLPHFENNFWKFSGKDWFENDPSTNYINDPEWYCPDLIKLILETKVKHEIGFHTFSLIDCR